MHAYGLILAVAAFSVPDGAAAAGVFCEFEMVRPHPDPEMLPTWHPLPADAPLCAQARALERLYAGLRRHAQAWTAARAAELGVEQAFSLAEVQLAIGIHDDGDFNAYYAESVFQGARYRRVEVTRGFLEATADDPATMAMVAAHELGHAAQYSLGDTEEQRCDRTMEAQADHIGFAVLEAGGYPFKSAAEVSARLWGRHNLHRPASEDPAMTACRHHPSAASRYVNAVLRDARVSDLRERAGTVDDGPLTGAFGYRPRQPGLARAEFTPRGRLRLEGELTLDAAVSPVETLGEEIALHRHLRRLGKTSYVPPANFVETAYTEALTALGRRSDWTDLTIHDVLLHSASEQPADLRTAMLIGMRNLYPDPLALNIALATARWRLQEGPLDLLARPRAKWVWRHRGGRRRRVLVSE